MLTEAPRISTKLWYRRKRRELLAICNRTSTAVTHGTRNTSDKPGNKKVFTAQNAKINIQVCKSNILKQVSPIISELTCDNKNRVNFINSYQQSSPQCSPSAIVHIKQTGYRTCTVNCFVHSSQHRVSHNWTTKLHTQTMPSNRSATPVELWEPQWLVQIRWDQIM
jgi:hypothetical protein